MDALRSHIVRGTHVVLEGFAALETIPCSLDVGASEILGCSEVDKLELMALC